MRSKTRVQFWLEGHLFLFFGLVFAPLVFAWVILDLVDSQNRLAYETRVQQAEGAVNFIGAQQRATLIDYAVWNTMYAATVQSEDLGWFDANAGSGVGENPLWSGDLVFDGSLRPVMGAWGARSIAWDPTERFGPAFATLFQELGSTTDTAVSGFLATNGQIASVSIARIQPHDGEIADADPLRFLAIVNILDAKAADKLRSSLSWPDLSIAPDLPDGPSLAIRSPDGRVIGYLGWKTPKLANEALSLRRVVIGIAFLMTSLATLGLHWKMRQAVRRMVGAEQAALKLAESDALTDIGNRRHFTAAGEALASAGGPLQALVIDLDGFKQVNDRRRHRAGDQLLIEASRRIASVLPEGTVLGRLGGDEFGVLARGAGAGSEAVELAQDVIWALAAPFAFGTDLRGIQASVGVAGSDGMLSFEELMRRADVAMYAAKSAGDGRPRAYRESLDQEERLTVAIDREMRAGLERGEFSVAYQPIVSAQDGRIVAVEALLRWTSPERGPVSPNLFIPIAERSRFVIALGEFVLDTACRDLAGSGLDISVSVNLSPVQLMELDLVDRVGMILARTGLPVRQLSLEVTETFLVESEQEATGLLQRLRAKGIAISLDDFGCGYSSIGYLRAFPLDNVKIDRSFIAPIETDIAARKVLRAIIDLCRSFNMSITAEGVETAFQAEFLREANCDRLQGYYFARPGALPTDVDVYRSLRPGLAGTGA